LVTLGLRLLLNKLLILLIIINRRLQLARSISGIRISTDRSQRYSVNAV